MRLQITVLVFVLVLNQSLSQTDSLKNTYTSDTLPAFSIPLFNAGADEAEAGAEQQDISGLLQASRDLYAQFAAFQFGQARFRMRGLETGHHQVLINGVDLSDPGTGVSSWSTWGGLNHVTRFSESRFGNAANRYGFSGAGGYTNIEANASAYKKGTRLSYTSSGRIYHHRLMFTHYGGINGRGWAHSLSGSLRYGDEVMVPGTYFKAWALYFSAEKRFSHRQKLSLTAFTAPAEQGRRSAAVAEVYALTGDPLYNSAWGYQNGKVRNARVSRSSKPTLMLSHTFSSGRKTKLISSLVLQTGSKGLTGILSGDAPNPRPDYYKNLPSWHYHNGDTSAGDVLAGRWATHPETGQINWDKLIAMNQANLYSDPNSQTINTTETRGRYVLENNFEKQQQLTANLLWQKNTGHWFLTAGTNGKLYNSRRYKIAEDLLGASFWLDEDQFAENLGVEPSIKQNDIDRPNRKVRQGEKFGHDYSIHVQRAEIWSQAEYSGRHFELYAGASFLLQRIWREGHVANGKFPTNSKGTSQVYTQPNSGIKAGVNYKISGRQYLAAAATILSRAPRTEALFISPATRNTLVDDVSAEKVSSGELSYNLRTPYVKLRVTVYTMMVRDQIWLRTYWHDQFNATVNMIMKQVNSRYRGLEFAIEKSFSGRHVLQSAFGYAEALYAGRPVLEAWQDNNSAVLFSGETAYLNNYRNNASPQLATGVSYRFNGRKMWFAALSFNHFDQIYVDVNPYRRTVAATDRFLGEEQALVDEITAQQKLPSWQLMNFSANKSIRIPRKKMYLSLNLSINNLLNNTGTIQSGFEQLRWDQAETAMFPPKYSYVQGRSYMLIITFIM